MTYYDLDDCRGRKRFSDKVHTTSGAAFQNLVVLRTSRQDLRLGKHYIYFFSIDNDVHSINSTRPEGCYC
jgi:hypothetical protein